MWKDFVKVQMKRMTSGVPLVMYLYQQTPEEAELKTGSMSWHQSHDCQDELSVKVPKRAGIGKAYEESTVVYFRRNETTWASLEATAKTRLPASFLAAEPPAAITCVRWLPRASNFEQQTVRPPSHCEMSIPNEALQKVRLRFEQCDRFA